MSTETAVSPLYFSEIEDQGSDYDSATEVSVTSKDEEHGEIDYWDLAQELAHSELPDLHMAWHMLIAKAAAADDLAGFNRDAQFELRCLRLTFDDAWSIVNSLHHFIKHAHEPTVRYMLGLILEVLPGEDILFVIALATVRTVRCGHIGSINLLLEEEHEFDGIALFHALYHAYLAEKGAWLRDRELGMDLSLAHLARIFDNNASSVTDPLAYRAVTIPLLPLYARCVPYLATVRHAGRLHHGKAMAELYRRLDEVSWYDQLASEMAFATYSEEDCWVVLDRLDLPREVAHGLSEYLQLLELWPARLLTRLWADDFECLR
ncbi:hypothetical protein BJY01DRAFT_247858 [Aspergillus pseudoustus]|uniref:Uncharacterized protein n=1 Tax=Aspergillus pseudoustus TaxID=1810923 RepID=A0ABR4K1K0_9EURO